MKFNKDNFDKKSSIDSDIIWWKNNILGSFSTIRIENPSFTMTTDALTIVWGAAFNNTSLGGQFSITVSILHSNVLELEAILFGLRSLCDHICNSHKRLSGYTAAVHWINNMGSCRSVDYHKITKSF